jgi:MbtH protein
MFCHRGERTHVFEDDDRTLRYRVVVNDEERYLIRRVDRKVPSGWRNEGTSGTKAACLSRIAEV